MNLSSPYTFQNQNSLSMVEFDQKYKVLVLYITGNGDFPKKCFGSLGNPKKITMVYNSPSKSCFQMNEVKHLFCRKSGPFPILARKV